MELVIGFAFAMVMHRIIFARGVDADLDPDPLRHHHRGLGVRLAVRLQPQQRLRQRLVPWLPGISADTNWFGAHWPAMFAIMVSEIWKTTPFMALLLLAGLSQVSEDMLEAAQVDGATWWQRLYKVILPNMRAAIMVAVLFRALDAFRIFDNIFIMTKGAQDTESISFLTYRQVIEQIQLGMGSALSVLLFLAVLLLAFLIVQGCSGSTWRRRGVRADERQVRAPAPGSASSLILVWCLLPVVWIISLSFKSVAETTVGSPQFLPEDWTIQNYKDIIDNPDFTRALLQLVRHRADLTVLAVIFATFAAYAIARLEFRGKRLVLSLALAIAMFPVVALVGPLFDMWRAHRPVQHLAGADHPVHVVHAAAGDLDAVGVLPGDPLGDGAGRPGRRRHVVAGLPQGDRPARGAGRVHGRDPDLLLRLERVRARDLADVDDGRRAPCRPSCRSSSGRTRSTRRTPSWRRPRSW